MNSAAALDNIVEQVAPALESAGFQRRGRTFMAGRDGGPAVFVMFREQSGLGPVVNFVVDWQAVPAVFRECAVELGRPPTDIEFSVIRGRVGAASGFQESPNIPSLWAVGGTDPELGIAALSNALREVIPTWNQCLTREGLADLTAGDGEARPSPNQAFRTLGLYADDGDSEVLEHALRTVEAVLPNNQMVGWLRDRVAGRR